MKLLWCFVGASFSSQSCFMTKSNRKCQNWSVKVPHEHKYFKKYGWTDNACRAYDHDVPWCYTTDPNKRWEECDCSLEDDGICYTTRLNRRCQYWSTQSPHEHDYFDRYGWVDNFCRKVDHDAPWCYTTDPDKRWEECDCHQEDDGICNETRSNRRCQQWNKNSPHEHDYPRWADNKCRQIDHDAPWCYTTDPDKRWEECDCK